jgi:twitching motility protein PilT
MDAELFKKLLVAAIHKDASDIHLQVGASPMLRINGELLKVKYHPLSPLETQAVVDEILSQTTVQSPASALSELDVAYSLEGHGRFRANIYRQRGSYNIVLRTIPILIKSFSELNLPPILEKISSLRRGLVLVVGATGNGKSTTLAAMSEHINNTRRAHIITIEEPIEYLFKNDKSVISQREVGIDTVSYSKATVAATCGHAADVPVKPGRCVVTTPWPGAARCTVLLPKQEKSARMSADVVAATAMILGEL